MRELALNKVYQLLEPGPVVLLSTAHHDRANVMTMSWHMMVEFEPPLVACVVSNAITGLGRNVVQGPHGPSFSSVNGLSQSY